MDPVVRIRIRWLLSASAVGLVVLVFTYVVFVRTAPGQRFDDLAFDGRAVEDPEITAATNDLLHSVTRSSLVLLTGAIVAFALARRRIRLAFTVGASIVASVVTTEVLKLHVLERPDLDDIAGIAQNSFPSGHATIGMSLSLGLVMVAPHRSRWLAAIVAMAVSMTFGVGVLATGWHRPSDTIGAFAVCMIVFGVTTAGLLRWRGRGAVEQRRMGAVEARLSVPVAIVAALLVAATAVVIVVSTFREDSVRTVEFALDYAAVSVVILVLAAVIVVGYHELLRAVALDAPDHARDQTPGVITSDAGRSPSDR